MHPFVLVCLVSSGCLAGKLDSNSRPSVMPKLSELPGDAEKRDAILNQSAERARPENRRSFSPKERQAETAAAVAAALLGQAFSKTQNVTLGVATDIDENTMFGPAAARREKQQSGPTPVAPVKVVPATELVPWIKLPADDADAAQKSKPAATDSTR